MLATKARTAAGRSATRSASPYFTTEKHTFMDAH